MMLQPCKVTKLDDCFWRIDVKDRPLSTMIAVHALDSWGIVGDEVHAKSLDGLLEAIGLTRKEETALGACGGAASVPSETAPTQPTETKRRKGTNDDRKK